MMRQTTSPSLIGHYSGFTSRALAFMIDSAIIGITLISISWVVSVAVTMLQVRSLMEFLLKAIPGGDQVVNILFGPTVASLLTTLYILGYHLFFMVLMGQTPGKVLMGLRVVQTDGGRLNAWRAFVRVIGYLVSALPLFLGFFWVIIDDRRQAWHDKLAGTFAIYTWAARPDERFLVDEERQLTGSDQTHTDLETKGN